MEVSTNNTNNDRLGFIESVYGNNKNAVANKSSDRAQQEV